MTDSTTPVTQAALDRLERTIASLMQANDQRYEQRFLDSQTAVGAALSAARTAVDAALSAAKEAVAKAEGASEKRFEGVNEFRAALADQQRNLIPRSEAELRFNSAEARLAVLEKLNSESKGERSGGRETWGYLIGAIGLLLALAGFFYKARP
jgi:hypothetical protein